MAISYYQDPYGAPDYSAEGMPSLLSLSNLESLVRGTGAGLLDLPYLYEGMFQGDIDPRMKPRKRLVPSSEQILATTPRMTAPTPQAGLLETVGGFMSPAPMAAVKPLVKGAKAIGKTVGNAYLKEIDAAMMGERGGLLGALTPQPLYMAENVGKVKAIDVLFPSRTQASLTSAEKSALTKYKKSLDVPAVMRRERLALEGGGDIVEPTPGEVFRQGLGIDPTYLDKKYVVPVSSDWSGGGETIKQAAGVPLARPVKKQAGTKYGLLEQNIEEDVGWASMPGAASSKTNNLNEYADLGDTVGVSSLLGQDSSNFSHHIAQGLIGQLPVLRPSKDATKLLDFTIQNKFVPKKLKDGTTIRTQPFKNFPGVTSENIYDIMAQGTKEYSAGDIRKAIAEEMSKAEFRDLGFPRWDTFTNLVNEPGAYTGASGGVMFKAKPKGTILTPTYEHGSYSSGIPTEGVLGGFKNAAGEIVTVPDYKIFRKTFDRLRKQGKTDANIRTSILKAHHGEQVDQQTIDGLLQYLGYIP